MHPELPLMHSGDCRVEYFYIWPEDAKDGRTWLIGLVRTSIMQGNHLHNHPYIKKIKKFQLRLITILEINKNLKFKKGVGIAIKSKETSSKLAI